MNNIDRNPAVQDPRHITAFMLLPVLVRKLLSAELGDSNPREADGYFQAFARKEFPPLDLKLVESILSTTEYVDAKVDAYLETDMETVTIPAVAAMPPTLRNFIAVFYEWFDSLMPFGSEGEG